MQQVLQAVRCWLRVRGAVAKRRLRGVPRGQAQGARERRGLREVVDHAVPARALPEDGDVVAVAAEGADVGLDPHDGGALIHDAEVAGAGARGARGELGAAHEAEDVQAVVERDHDDAQRRGPHEARAAVEAARARLVPAAVDPCPAQVRALRK